MNSAVAQAIGLSVGFILTLMVFSYLLGDNPLSRLAIHILVGAGVGYAIVVILYRVINPKLLVPLWSIAQERSESDWWLNLILILLSILLLSKMWPRLSRWGDIPIALIIGTASAVAIGGVVIGTLIPQILSTIHIAQVDSVQAFESSPGTLSNFIAAMLIIVGTLSTLLVTHYSTLGLNLSSKDRRISLRYLTHLGWFFLAIAFGSLFSGAVIASLTILADRAQFLIDAPTEIIRLLGLG